MSATKTAISVPPEVAMQAPDAEAHRSDLEKRREAQLKKRPKLLKCLDPITAAQYETKKALYEYKVECEIFRPADKKRRATTEAVTEQVVAQNDNDAWAMFCDKIGQWPSRRDSNAKITRLEKRTLRDEE
jgi:hypothetical protein